MVQFAKKVKVVDCVDVKNVSKMSKRQWTFCVPSSDPRNWSVKKKKKTKAFVNGKEPTLWHVQCN